MGLGKRVISAVDLILQEDSAIDSESSDYEKYLKTFDRKHLTLVEGEHPTIFRIRPLTYAQRMELDSIDVDDLARRCEFAVRCGLEKVENYTIETGGTEMELQPVQRRREGRLGELVTKDWLSEANFPSSQTFSLANAISILSEGKRPLP